MRKQNHPIELFIVTNFILMKSTRFHYSGLGHNLCYKETSAVTKFAIMRSAHWRIQGQGWGGVSAWCRAGQGVWGPAEQKSPRFPVAKRVPGSHSHTNPIVRGPTCAHADTTRTACVTASSLFLECRHGSLLTAEKRRKCGRGRHHPAR